MALVYVTDIEYQADIKVFAVNERYQADLCFSRLIEITRPIRRQNGFLKIRTIKRRLKYIGLSMSIRQILKSSGLRRNTWPVGKRATV